MIKRRAFLASALAASLAPGSVRAQPASDFVPGSVLVARQLGVSPSDPRIAAVVVKHHAIPGVDIRPLGITEWRVSPGDEAAFSADMEATGVIKFTELNARGQAQAFAVPPNDPQYSNQWYITQMNVPAAWTALGSYGNPAIVIADCNMGNSASADAPVNTRTGWNVVTSNTNTADVDYTCANPTIPGGHGTGTESIVFAATDNATDIAGVAAGCTLMPVVIFACTGGPSGVTVTSAANIAAGIVWAGGNGANIISVNASLVGSTVSGTMQAAVAGAVAAGCLVVCSTNDGNPKGTPYSGPCSPGAAQLVLTAVPISGDNTIPSFSGGGNYVAIAAPGGTSFASSGVGIPYLGADNNVYTNQDGVSFTIPLLAGVAGLVGSAQLASSQGKWNANDCSATLLATATKINSQTGWNSNYGVGLVNAGAAVAAALIGRLPNNQSGLLGVG